MQYFIPITSIFVFLYLLLLAGTTIYIVRRSKGGGATRQEGHGFKRSEIALSFFGTYFSAGTVIGGLGFFYNLGIGTLMFGAIAYIALGAVSYPIGLVVMRRVRNSVGNESLLSLISNDLGGGFIKLLFMATTLIFLIPYVSLQIAGIGKFLQIAIGANYIVSISITVAVICAYTLIGGLRVVVVSDVFQSVMVLLGMSLLAGTVFYIYFDFSPSALKIGIAEARKESFWAVGDGFLTYPKIVSFALIYSLGSFAQPQIMQRFLMCKDKGDVRFMSWLISLGGVLLISSLGLIAACGLVVAPGLDSGDALFGALFRNEPMNSRFWASLISAIAFVGIIAASMSTADSLLISFTSVFSEDREIDSLSDISSKRRWIGLVVVAVAFVISMDPPRLIATLSVMAFSGMLMLFPALVVGLYRIPVDSRFVASSIFIPVTMIILSKFGSTSLDMLGFDVAFWAFLVSIIICLIGFALGKKSSSIEN